MSSLKRFVCCSSWLHIAGIAHSRLRKFSHRSSHLPSRNGVVLCGVLQKLFKIYFFWFFFLNHFSSITYFLCFGLITTYCVVRGTNFWVILIITVCSCYNIFQVFKVLLMYSNVSSADKVLTKQTILEEKQTPFSLYDIME